MAKKRKQDDHQVKTIDYGSGPLEEHVAEGAAALSEVETASDDVDSSDPAEADLVAEQPPRPEVNLVTVTLPLGPIDPKEYRSPHIDMHLSPAQAETLRKLTNGLRGFSYELTADGGEFRSEGRLVDTGAKAIQWLLNGLAIAERRRAAEKLSEDSAAS